MLRANLNEATLGAAQTALDRGSNPNIRRSLEGEGRAPALDGMQMSDMPGVDLPGLGRLVHGDGATVQRPFPTMPLAMHEFDPGSPAEGARAFHGPIGFIQFTTALRLPRHVHLDRDEPSRLLPERILVLEGTALVELSGAVFVVPPRSLVDIEAGVPHCWTACPAGARLPDGTITDGRFLMIYAYASPTAFAPIASTQRLARAADYVPFQGDLAEIQFPSLDLEAVIAGGDLLWNRSLGRHALTRG